MANEQEKQILSEIIGALEEGQTAFLQENADLVNSPGLRYIAAIFPFGLKANADGDLIAVEPVALIPAEVAMPDLDKLITVTPHTGRRSGRRWDRFRGVSAVRVTSEARGEGALACRGEP